MDYKNEYVLSRYELNKMKNKCSIAKEIDKMLNENNLFTQPKEQSSKITIIIKKEHIPMIDNIMLQCIVAQDSYGADDYEKYAEWL